jgi:2,4-dienoyl-CoA reductase-like NADH-dependent reductase (Old Yellow Enzyme family)
MHQKGQVQIVQMINPNQQMQQGKAQMIQQGQVQLVQVLRVLAQNPSWKTNAAGFKVKLIIINKIYAI